MALLHFDVKSVSRGKGSSAVQRAAYVSREKLRDERRGRTFDHRARGGLEHSEILKPGAATAAPAWSADRAALWNRAEQAEPRRNARVAREYVLGLPHELSAEARLDLARTFAQRISDRYGTAVDLAVHRAPPGGDERNHHAHVLSSTRVMTGEGFGAKSNAELNDTMRRSRGLPTAREEIRQLRHEWAALVNERLQAAELAVRVDARSYWEQGTSQLPKPHLPRGAIYAERAGQHSPVADALRARHAAEQALMTRYAAERAVALAPARGATEGVIDGPATRPTSPAAEAPARSVDDIARRARERWLAMREQNAGVAAGGEKAPGRGRERGRELGVELEL